MSQNMYVLRVRLSWAKRVWRELAVLGDMSLDELHRYILEAFEWSEEDSYSFYMSGVLNDRRTLFAPDNDDPKHDSRLARLDDFGLEEGQNFLYVFGDSDRNQFSLKVMILDNPDPRATYPDVVDEDGESPEQALAYEENEE
jgi:hypothetical protein